MTAEVHQLRERISKLKANVAELQLDRLTRDETVRRLDDWVDRQAARVNARALVLSATEGTGRINSEALTCYGRPQADGHAAANLAPYLCWLDPDQMKSRLLAELETVPADQFSSKKPGARKAALAKSQAELDQLERDEEAAIVAAESAGQHIPRRRDVRPEIVLAAMETEDA